MTAAPSLPDHFIIKIVEFYHTWDDIVNFPVRVAKMPEISYT